MAAWKARCRWQRRRWWHDSSKAQRRLSGPALPGNFITWSGHGRSRSCDRWPEAAARKPQRCYPKTPLWFRLCRVRYNGLRMESSNRGCMHLLYLLPAGLVVGGVQVAVLPWPWSSPVVPLCMLSVVVLGWCYAMVEGSFADGKNPKKTSMLVLCLFLVSWFSPAFWVIYRSRAEFYRLPTSHGIAHATRAGHFGERPLFVLVSDLHVTDRPKTLEYRPGHGIAAGRLLPAIARLNPRLCIISGDLTDRGNPAEWHLLDDLLKRYFARPGSRSQTRLLMVPGNHDLQGAPSEVVSAAFSLGNSGDRTPEISFGGRTVEFYKIAAEWEGELLSPSGTRLRDGSFMSIWKSIRDDAAKKTVRVYRAGGRPGTGGRPYVVFTYPPGFSEKLESGLSSFNAFFPLSYGEPDTGLEVLLLNSSAKISLGASMGLGSLGSRQLQALRQQLMNLQRQKLKYLIVVLHHAPVKRESDKWTWKQAFSRHPGDSDVYAHTFLALDPDDAQEFMSILGRFAKSRPDVEVVVLHGHRHGTFIGRADEGILVVEAPAVVESAPGVWMGDQTSKGLQVSWLPVSNLP
jgi:hypothetical protein